MDGWQGIIEVIARLISIGVSIAEGLGQRDAFITALDAALAVARAQTDRDLLHKHRDPA